jgi:hypothetical protein
MKTISFVVMILMFLSLGISMAEIIFVTTTSDTGIGSLRQAIIKADTSSRADTIQFNIPTSDPGYNGDRGVWMIQPDTVLPSLLGDSTFINGNSQSLHQGDTNPYGPEIEIDGTNVEESGIIIEGSFNKVSGLVINRFAYYGILIGDTEAFNNIIVGNYIGTDATGEIALGNVRGGIQIYGDAEGTVIGGLSPSQRNVISGSTYHGNIYHGNGITIKGAYATRILGNYIGTNKDGTAALPNVDYGISLTFGENNIIGGLEEGAANVISGNLRGGIFIRFTETTNNTILGNYIGTDVTGKHDLGNWFEGIYLDYGTKNNVIGPQNVIRYNGNYGIVINHDSTTGIRITQNSISNHGFGISLKEGGNDSLAAPIIDDVTETSVSGTACADCIVEIFSDSLVEGAIYEGTVTADVSGDFSWTGTVNGPNVTAVAIDTAGNTSPFSTPFVTDIEEWNNAQIPMGYWLSQNFPNPFNPVTTIKYSVRTYNHTPQHVNLSIYNLLGQKVATLVDERQQAGYHQVEWDASGFANGIYYYQLRAGSYVKTEKMILLK